MNKLIIFIALLFCHFRINAELPISIKFKNTNFELCAKERVTKLFFNIVDVGIYYPNCNKAQNIFDQDTKLLRFSYLREVTGKQFTQGAIEYLQENLSQQDKLKCFRHFESLNRTYQNVSSGDYYDLYFLKKEGIELQLNNERLHNMNNPECNSAYLNVWFGKETMDNQFHDLADKIKP